MIKGLAKLKMTHLVWVNIFYSYTHTLINYPTFKTIKQQTSNSFLLLYNQKGENC